MDYDKISGVFERLESRFGWEPMKEAGLTIGEWQQQHCQRQRQQKLLPLRQQ
jgi:hypothetical protein